MTTHRKHLAQHLARVYPQQTGPLIVNNSHNNSKGGGGIPSYPFCRWGNRGQTWFHEFLIWPRGLQAHAGNHFACYLNTRDHFYDLQGCLPCLRSYLYQNDEGSSGVSPHIPSQCLSVPCPLLSLTLSESALLEGRCWCFILGLTAQRQRHFLLQKQEGGGGEAGVGE